jgi:hypothetical protein
MSPLHIIYSQHAVREMRKAQITRQVVRRVLQDGRRELEFVRQGEEHWTSTLRIENKAYSVVWIQQAGHVFIQTVYRIGEYD